MHAWGQSYRPRHANQNVIHLVGARHIKEGLNRICLVIDGFRQAEEREINCIFYVFEEVRHDILHSDFTQADVADNSAVEI